MTTQSCLVKEYYQSIVDGKIIDGKIIDGKIIDGKIKQEFTIVDGKKDGICKGYYQSGTIKKVCY